MSWVDALYEKAFGGDKQGYPELASITKETKEPKAPEFTHDPECPFPTYTYAGPQVIMHSHLGPCSLVLERIQEERDTHDEISEQLRYADEQVIRDIDSGDNR